MFMILESTILALCISGYECSTGPRAYYLTRPDLRTWVKEQSKEIKELTEPYHLDVVLATTAGFILISSGNRVNLRITKNVSVSIREEEFNIRLTYVF